MKKRTKKKRKEFNTIIADFNLDNDFNSAIILTQVPRMASDCTEGPRNQVLKGNDAAGWY